MCHLASQICPLFVVETLAFLASLLKGFWHHIFVQSQNRSYCTVSIDHQAEILEIGVELISNRDQS
jgi:hypothetical protein